MKKLTGLLAGLLVIILVIGASDVFELGGSLLRVLFPVLIGFFVAFALNIPLKWLEGVWGKIEGRTGKRTNERLKRAVCILVCLLLSIGIPSAFFILATPYIRSCVDTLVAAAPALIDKAESIWSELSQWLSRYSIDLPPLNAEMIVDTVKKYFQESEKSLLGLSFDVATSIVGVVFNGVVALVIGIYTLAFKERLAIQMKKLLRALLDGRRYESAVKTARICNETLASFLVGQLSEAAILGGLCFFGMLIFGFPFAPLISLIVGVSALIPVFGAFFGIGVGALLILLYEPTSALWFVVFLTVLQQIEGNLIYPRVVGRSVGLPSLWVLVAVTIGSSLGVLGMLVSVPFASVIYKIVSQSVSEKLRGREIS